MNSLDVLEILLRRNPSICVLHMVPITSSVFVQDALAATDVNQEQIAAALLIRSNHKFSFWDALCSVFIDNTAYSRALLEKVVHHNCNTEVLPVKSVDFLSGNMCLVEDKQYAVTSKVIMDDGRTCHIPMVDFHCGVNDSNERLVTDVVKELDVGRGYILNSGKSYHFIGTSLVELGGLGGFMGRMIMFNPIIDKAWVAHQLIEGYCALRITERNTLLPEVVEEVTLG